MKKKVLKYPLTIALLLLIGYNSVYFKKLNEVKAAAASTGFNAAGFAQDFYYKKLPGELNKAIDIEQLITLLKTAPKKTFQQYSHSLNIGNVRYFLVQGSGTIASIGEDACTVIPEKDSTGTAISIATEFVYGNSIRDASGLIHLNDFSSTADINNVSEEINKIIRKEVLSPFKKAVKKGDVIHFTGAIQLNQAHLKLDSIEVVPAQLTIPILF